MSAAASAFPPENISASTWSLRGSIEEPPQLLKSAHSLTLIRRKDQLSVLLGAYQNSHGVIPKVVIVTRGFTATLTNAVIIKIEFIKPGVRGNIRSSHEVTEVKFNFAQITITSAEGGTTAQDDWNAQA